MLQDIQAPYYHLHKKSHTSTWDHEPPLVGGVNHPDLSLLRLEKKLNVSSIWDRPISALKITQLEVIALTRLHLS
jgi:hypothetical protein